METISKKIFDRFDGLQMLSSPEWLEQCKREIMIACRQVLMDQASVVSYPVEGGSESQQKQIDNGKFFQRMFDDIRLFCKLRIPPTLAK